MSASTPRRVISALAAASLLCGSTAASAAAGPTTAQISPWAVLSVFGTQSSKATVCGAAASSTAAAQNGRPGCVLPALDAPPAPPPAEQAVVPAAYPAVAGEMGIPPLLLALAAIATGAFLLAMNGDDDEDAPLSPG